MPSPPKPWERAGATALPSIPSSTLSSSAPSSSIPPSTSAPGITMSSDPSNIAASANPPSIPARPSSMTAARPGMYNSYGTGYNSGYSSGYSSGHSPLSTYNRFGSSYSPYSSYSSMSSYSPYTRPYSSYGSLGSYGSYGGSYSPYSRPYGAGPGPGPYGDPSTSLVSRMEQSTQATFQLLDSIVQAFAGFSHMLESTFHATHSSFMAMVGVAEQFGHLRNYLGQVLSVFMLIRGIKKMIYRLLGWKLPVNSEELNTGEFEKFTESAKYSKRPLMLFLLAVVGLPYLMSKLIKLLSRRSQQQLPPGSEQSSSTQPSFEIARALYDFAGENPMELTLKKGDVVAVLDKVDPSTGQVGTWWRGKLQNGPVGWFPANYVEILKKSSSNPASTSSDNPQPTPDSSNPASNPSSINPASTMGPDFQKSTLTSATELSPQYINGPPSAPFNPNAFSMEPPPPGPGGFDFGGF